MVLAINLDAQDLVACRDLTFRNLAGCHESRGEARNGPFANMWEDIVGA